MPAVNPQGAQKYWGPRDTTYLLVKTGTLDEGGQKYWGPYDQALIGFTGQQQQAQFHTLSVAP